MAGGDGASPDKAASDKAASDTVVLDHLSLRMCEFIAGRGMVFIAGPDGEEPTYRAGPPGFIRVFDRRRLGWPEFREQRAVPAPHVGLLFVDLLRHVVRLRVTGVATVVPHDAMLAAYPDLLDIEAERDPDRWVSVRVTRTCLTRAAPVN